MPNAMSRPPTNPRITPRGGPSVLGESQLRLPVGGKIRAGILVISNRFDSQEGLESLPDTATEQPAKPAKKPPCR